MGSGTPEVAASLYLYCQLQWLQEQPGFPWLRQMAAWEELEKVTTLVGTVFVPYHLGAASGTENAPRQNPWLTCIALVSEAPALILCCQKKSITAIKNPKQTTGKQAYVQSLRESEQNMLLPEPVFAYGYLIYTGKIYSLQRHNRENSHSYEPCMKNQGLTDGRINIAWSI